MSQIRPRSAIDRRSIAGWFPVNIWDRWLTDKYYDDKRELELSTIKDCNFTVAGFISADDVCLVEDLDLRAFVFGDEESPTFDEWKEWWGSKAGKKMDEELANRIDKKIKSLADRARSNAVFGLFLYDEPGASLFPVLGKAVESIRRHAPGKKAYINLLPNYADKHLLSGSPDQEIEYAEYLDRFVREVEPGPEGISPTTSEWGFLSFDNYEVEMSLDLMNEGGAADYYTNLLEVRQVALQQRIPFWAILSSAEISTGLTVPSPANLSFQAYTALAAGAGGITWFNYFTTSSYSPLKPSGGKTLTWYYVREINRQLKQIGPLISRLSSTGVYFHQFPLKGPFDQLPGRFVKSIDASGPIMVGEFEDKTQQSKDESGYALVVNLSLEKSVSIRVVPQSEVSVQYISAADREVCPFPQDSGYWLVAGQGLLLRLG